MKSELKESGLSRRSLTERTYGTAEAATSAVTS